MTVNMKRGKTMRVKLILFSMAMIGVIWFCANRPKTFDDAACYRRCDKATGEFCDERDYDCSAFCVSKCRAAKCLTERLTSQEWSALRSQLRENLNACSPWWKERRAVCARRARFNDLQLDHALRQKTASCSAEDQPVNLILRCANRRAAR